MEKTVTTNIILNQIKVCGQDSKIRATLSWYDKLSSHRWHDRFIVKFTRLTVQIHWKCGKFSLLQKKMYLSRYSSSSDIYVSPIVTLLASTGLVGAIFSWSLRYSESGQRGNPCSGTTVTALHVGHENWPFPPARLPEIERIYEEYKKVLGTKEWNYNI